MQNHDQPTKSLGKLRTGHLFRWGRTLVILAITLGVLILHIFGSELSRRISEMPLQKGVIGRLKKLTANMAML